MGIFSKLRRGREKRWMNGDVMEREEGTWWSVFAGRRPNSVSVTERNSLQMTTVFACVRIIAETIASLPMNVYKRGADGVKNKATDHPLWTVLHDEANDEMTAFTFWETMVAWVLTWGNAYAEIERDGSGKVVAIWPISPDVVQVDKRAGATVYKVTVDDPSGDASGSRQVVLPAEKVLHFHGLGWNGISGYSPIAMARNSLNFAKSTEVYGANFFENGAQPSGVLEMEGVLRDTAARDRLRESWYQIHGGPRNSHRVAVLEAGVKYKPISLPPNDAQFLETRRYQKADIAQMFRVPLHMINDLTNATFSNIEHQSIEFVVHTIRPYLVRMEQEIRRKLFVTTSDKNNYCAEWLVDGLLRGDAKSRNEALQIQRQNGIISADEWREIENMNPQDGGQGKAYLVNSAMISVDQALVPRDAATQTGKTGGADNQGGGDTSGKGTKSTGGTGGNPKK